jgi:hypothetical protein
MRTFTVITEVDDVFHVSQHRSTWSQTARSEPTLLEVGGCEGTWMLLEGARHSPQYSTYVVRTDVVK